MAYAAFHVLSSAFERFFANFAQFIERVEDRCIVHDIDSPVDYRMLAASSLKEGDMQTYFHPLADTAGAPPIVWAACQCLAAAWWP